MHSLGKGFARLLVAASVCLVAAPANAIPAFARKYGTSCQTCHTIYPKLTPFGEGFRRNGYRFPGIDSDFVKQEPVALGQEGYKKVFPNAVWPGTLPSGVPIALGFNGMAVLHPDVNSGGGQADNGTAFSTRDLVAEAHVYAGGSYDDKITYFSEVTVGTDGTIDVEHAHVHFNDLLGPAHLVNLSVGKQALMLSSFGAHSSYVADMLMASAPVAGLYGATSDTFNLNDHYTGVELSGVAMGRLDYSVGLNAGANLLVRPTENVYAHLGYKLGGLRLDGENAQGAGNAEKPWAETAFTLDAFAYHANSQFTSAGGTTTQDTALVYGGGLRLQVQSFELSSGLYLESHNHAQADNEGLDNPEENGAKFLVQYNELSYVVFPWLVPAVRVEYLMATPQGGTGVTNLRVMPGVAMLIRPNLKATVVAQFEMANGAPPGGWGEAGGLAAPSEETPNVPFENESVTIGLATAF